MTLKFQWTIELTRAPTDLLRNPSDAHDHAMSNYMNSSICLMCLSVRDTHLHWFHTKMVTLHHVWTMVSWSKLTEIAKMWWWWCMRALTKTISLPDRSWPTMPIFWGLQAHVPGHMTAFGVCLWIWGVNLIKLTWPGKKAPWNLSVLVLTGAWKLAQQPKVIIGVQQGTYRTCGGQWGGMWEPDVNLPWRSRRTA